MQNFREESVVFFCGDFIVCDDEVDELDEESDERSVVEG